MIDVGHSDVRGDPKHLEPRLPDTDRFLVSRRIRIAFENGHEESERIDAEPVFARQEFERPTDRFLLEIIAQRPIPQHLEKSKVAVVADFFDIIGAQTLLRVCQPLAHGMRLPHEIRHKRMHASRGEQDGRVVFGQQRRRRDDGVALLTVKIHEFEPL